MNIVNKVYFYIVTEFIFFFNVPLLIFINLDFITFEYCNNGLVDVISDQQSVCTALI